MLQKINIWTWALCLLTVVGAAILWPREEVTPLAPVPVQVAKPQASQTPQPAIAVANTAAKPSLSAEIDRLAATGSPADLLEAYGKLKFCVGTAEFARKHAPERGAYNVPVEEACGDISNAQLRQRHDYLAKAVKAGVPGALLAKSFSGPHDGEWHVFTNRPDDPMIKEWRDTFYGELVDSAERTGSFEAMNLLAKFNMTGTLREKNEVHALGYHLAGLELARSSSNPDLQEHAKDPRTETYSKDLTPEQLAAANAFARALLAKCCRK